MYSSKSTPVSAVSVHPCVAGRIATEVRDNVAVVALAVESPED